MGSKPEALTTPFEIMETTGLSLDFSP